VKRSVKLSLCALGLALAGCAQSYSPQTYSTTAVQQVNKVESGVIVGFRQVRISASGTVGAVTGGAAGGVLGSRSNTVGIDAALGTVGGTALGTIIGTTVEHVSADAYGWEYIVRKTNGELLSVTQSEDTPLPLGQKVLVIAGNQARIVPDYSVEIAAPKAETKPEAKPAEKTTASGKKPAGLPLLVVPLSSDYAAAPAPAPEPAPAAAPEPAAQPEAQTPPAPEPAVQPEPQAQPAPEVAAQPDPQPEAQPPETPAPASDEAPPEAPADKAPETAETR